jgi:hypothetical protein
MKALKKIASALSLVAVLFLASSCITIIAKAPPRGQAKSANIKQGATAPIQDKSTVAPAKKTEPEKRPTVKAK